MTFIPTDAPVLVTGASGYIAGVLIRDLLAEGLTVHATLRDYVDEEEEARKRRKKKLREASKKANEVAELGTINEEVGKEEKEEEEKNKKKEDPPYQYLLDLPGAKLRLKLFKADLMKGRSFAKAMEGCSVVFHVASPNPEKMKNPYEEVVAPVYKGTKNVLNQAKKCASVKRVVLTSSIHAMYTDAMDLVESESPAIDETFWNETASINYQPKAFAKTEAEKDAWDKFEKQDKWDLVTICPGLVLGPGIKCHRENSSVSLVAGYGNGTRSAPEVPVSVVDVREVSRAHIEAAFRPEANGRYLVAAERPTNLYVISQLLRERYETQSDYNFPDRPASKNMLTTFGTLVDGTMCRKFVRRSYGQMLMVDSSRSQQELGIYYRPLRDTLYDMADQIVEEGLWNKAHMAEEARLAKEEEERIKEEKKQARLERREARLAREKEEREQAKLEKAAEKERLREERQREKEERAAEKEHLREERRRAKERGVENERAEEGAPMNSDSIV